MLKLKRTIASKEQIANMVKKLGNRISIDYKDKQLLLIGVLKGSFVFMADLIREITVPVDMDFIAVSSYEGSRETSGIIRLLKDIESDITGKDVLIVEDIIDTGLTVSYLVELFKTKKPDSIKVCTAFDKPSKRKKNIDIEYIGIEIPDEFVVGYGLDYNGKFRNLSELVVLKNE